MTESTYMKKNVNFGCIALSIAGVCWHFMSLHIHSLKIFILYHSVNNYGQTTGRWMQHVFCASQFSWRDISENSFFSLYTFPLKKSNMSSICLFPAYLIWKHSSQSSSIDINPSIIRQWRIMCAPGGIFWNRFGQVSGQQVALFWVCVDITWL